MKRLIVCVIAFLLASCAGPASVTKSLDQSQIEPQPGVVYYLDDHLGSAHMVTDSRGSVLREESIYPYGLDRAESGDGPIDYAYTGKEVDDETGLIYFGGRYYSPELGRWITPDPLFLEREPGKALELPRSINLYAYARNNPIAFIDPDGLVDLNLFNKSDVLEQYAHKVNSKNGEFSVGGHGDPTAIANEHNKTLTPSDLGKQLRERTPNYTAGQTVQLFSCNTGKGQEPFAQKLADIIQAPVIAPDNYVWMHYNGKTDVAPAKSGNLNNGPDLKNKGGWHTFYPRSPQAGGTMPAGQGLN